MGNKCGKIVIFLLLELNIWKNIKVEGIGIYWIGGCIKVCDDVIEV